MDLFAEYAYIEMPCLREGSPAPNRDTSPWSKVTDSPYFTDGIGLHLSWLGWHSMFYF